MPYLTLANFAVLDSQPWMALLHYPDSSLQSFNERANLLLFFVAVGFLLSTLQMYIMGYQ